MFEKVGSRIVSGIELCLPGGAANVGGRGTAAGDGVAMAGSDTLVDGAAAPGIKTVKLAAFGCVGGGGGVTDP
jgi:hypothetical protein